MCACHQGSLFGQQRLQVLGRQDWRGRSLGWEGGGGWPPFNFVIVHFGETYPGGDVGFVVERGDDDFRAGWEVEDEGEVGEELGC